MQKSKEQSAVDRRLIGTWQSDRRKTFEHWKPGKKATPASTRKFQALFGKLQVRYTKKSIYERFIQPPSLQSADFSSEFVRFAKYEIVAKDECSTVIRILPLKTTPVVSLSHEKLLQIHFNGPDCYFFALFPGLTECFRRVKTSPDS
jgi:hypothetical protein